MQQRRLGNSLSAWEAHTQAAPLLEQLCEQYPEDERIHRYHTRNSEQLTKLAAEINSPMTAAIVPHCHSR